LSTFLLLFSERATTSGLLYEEEPRLVKKLLVSCEKKLFLGSWALGSRWGEVRSK
jgi:hypothetical protein